ncbi:hypothetical protein HDV05_002016 [Chytridiales sp. JEL 0842]|nr:hypothetical protein HDV05_002016 [Chytridiales sp. JEL 0842]
MSFHALPPSALMNRGQAQFTSVEGRASVGSSHARRPSLSGGGPPRGGSRRASFANGRGRVGNMMHGGLPSPLGDGNGHGVDDQATEMVRTTHSTEEDEDFLVATSMLQRVRDIIFSVMFFMVHGNSANDIIEYFSFITEDLQLLNFFVTVETMKGIDLPLTLSNLLSANFNVVDMKNTYTILLALCTTAVFMLMINIIVVAWGFVQGQHKFIWPIRSLRLLAAFLPTVFYLPIFEVMVSALACNRVTVDPDPVVITLDNTPCTDPTRLPLVLLSAIATIVYIPTCIALAAVFYDTNPTLKGPSCRVHGRVDILYITLKTIIVVLYKFLDDNFYIPKMVAGLIACCIMYLAIIYYFPYYNKSINQIRGGLYSGAVFVGIISLATSANFQENGIVLGQASLAIVAATYIIGIAAGFWATGYIYTKIQTQTRHTLNIITTMGDQIDETKPETLVFMFPPHVEIAARFVTVFMDERRRRINYTGLAEMRALFKRGLIEFPHDQEAASHLSRVSQNSPPFDIQFQIYYANQQANQGKEADFLGFGVRLDVASYAEFQKTDRDAKLNHYLAIQEQRAMWQLLLDKDYKLEDLSSVATRLQTYAQKASESYMKLAAKFPRSRVILRYFARFCYDVSNDTLRGDALTERADDLESEECKVGGRNDEPTVIIPPYLGMSSNGMADFDEIHEDVVPHGSVGSMEPAGCTTPPNMETDLENGSGGALTPSKPKPARALSDLGSATSGSSDRKSQVTAQRNRAIALQRKSLRIQALIITSTLMALGIIIANFAITVELLKTTSSGLDTLSLLHYRERYTSFGFTRVRQMQEAARRNDTRRYKEVQSVYYEESANFTEVAEALYRTRDMTPVNNQYYTTPQVTAWRSYYPELNGTYESKVSLFDYMTAFAKSGLQISNITFADFNNSSKNNDVRFVLDNFWLSKVDPYDYSMDILYFDLAVERTIRANNLIYILTAVHVAIIFVFLVVLDYNVRIFRANQRRSLNIFRHIPKAVIHEIIQKMDEADMNDIFTSSIIKRSNSLRRPGSSSWSSNFFRLQYALYAFSISGLSIIFAWVNISGVYGIGQQFAVLDQSADMQVYFIRMYNIIKEMQNFDPETWENEAALRKNFIITYDRIYGVFDAIKFGDPERYPSPPSYNFYSDSLHKMLEHDPCLPYNITFCSPSSRKWNDTIGYNYNAVNLGLLHLTRVVMDKHTNFAIAAEKGPFTPDPVFVAFLDQVMEPDLIDGWNKVEEQTKYETKELYKRSVQLNIIIFVLEMLLVFLGQFIVVAKMMSNFKFMDQCIYDLLCRLPSQVKKLPEVAALIANDGTILETALQNLSSNEDKKFHELASAATTSPVSRFLQRVRSIGGSSKPSNGERRRSFNASLKKMVMHGGKKGTPKVVKTVTIKSQDWIKESTASDIAEGGMRVKHHDPFSHENLEEEDEDEEDIEEDEEEDEEEEEDEVDKEGKSVESNFESSPVSIPMDSKLEASGNP